MTSFQSMICICYRLITKYKSLRPLFRGYLIFGSSNGNFRQHLGSRISDLRSIPTLLYIADKMNVENGPFTRCHSPKHKALVKWFYTRKINFSYEKISS
jgi:hypothetical protein